jgi:hypothetical protein
VANGAQLRLYQTSLGANGIDLDEPYGSVLYAEGAGSSIRTESVEVWGSGGASAVFQAESGASLDVAYTTVALNRYVSGGSIVDAQGMRLGGTGTEGRIYTSIFHPTGQFVATNGASFGTVDCLITSTAIGLPAFASEVYTANPGYNDLGGGDLRVGSESPAVDFCDTFLYAPTQADLDGRARGYDVPGNPNGSPGPVGGRYDAGAYELHVLFADGFETGNTSRWSDALP